MDSARSFDGTLGLQNDRQQDEDLRTTSKSSFDVMQSRRCGCTRKQRYCVYMTSLSVALVIGIILLAVGILITGLVKSMIATKIANGVRIDPNTMSASGNALYLNSSGNQDFYIYNCTNLYAVLTTGVAPNFNQVKIMTQRILTKYNVTWDLPNSKVTYNQLTTYTVAPDSQYLLNQPIIGVNPFYLGLEATIMQQYVGPVNGLPTVQYPGNYLSESVGISGLMGGVLPQIVPQFSIATSTFLTQMRQGGLSAAYMTYGPNFVNKVGQVSGNGITWTAALNGWSTATSYLSLPSNGVSTYFTGFELARALTSTNTNNVIATSFFGTGAYGIGTTPGIVALATFLATPPAMTIAYQQAFGAACAGLGLSTGSAQDINNAKYDLQTIGGWLQAVTTTLPTPGVTDVGSSYEKLLTASVKFELDTVATFVNTTLFNLAFNNTAANGYAYTPTTWADVGALQFGSGVMLAAAASGSSIWQKNLIAYGQGMSTSDLDSYVATGAIPFNFADGAAMAEPMEFTAGIKYYVANNPYSASATAQLPVSQSMLWTYNPALLYLGGTSSATLPYGGTLINLNLAQATAFLKQLNSTTGYSQLLTQLLPLTTAYANSFGYYMQHGAGAAAAVAAANAAFASAWTTETAKTSSVIMSSGVTSTNWYSCWTYLFNYLGNELSGSLQQIDPSSGVSPLNSGLFNKRTVNEVLFGFTSKFGSSIPGIATSVYNPTTLQAALDADFKKSLGRQYVTDTGSANIATVGQWKQYLGTTQYQSNCDLTDPGRQYACNTAAGVQANNWPIWGAPVVVVGQSNSLQMAPMGENVRNPISFYVAEVSRAASAVWTMDYAFKGILLYRYGLNNALIQANFVTPNPDKNTAVWFQSGVPDGLFSIQTATGRGVPAVSGLPLFGLSDPSVYAGITCENQSCDKVFDPLLHSTYVDVEPLTGITMRGAKRLQANFRVSAKEYYTGAYSGYSAGTTTYGLNYHLNNLFANGRETIYLPYYWTDVHDEISDADASTARNAIASVASARALANGLMIALLIIGPVMIVAAIAGLVYVKKRCN